MLKLHILPKGSDDLLCSRPITTRTRATDNLTEFWLETEHYRGCGLCKQSLIYWIRIGQVQGPDGRRVWTHEP